MFSFALCRVLFIYIYSLFPLYQRLQHDSEQINRMKDKYIRRVYTYDTKACYNQQDRSDCWKSHQINIRGVPFKMSDLGSFEA